jgi:hypothetical protein
MTEMEEDLGMSVEQARANARSMVYDIERLLVKDFHDRSMDMLGLTEVSNKIDKRIREKVKKRRR